MDRSGLKEVISKITIFRLILIFEIFLFCLLRREKIYGSCNKCLNILELRVTGDKLTTQILPFKCIESKIGIVQKVIN
jgi:hypothetical protein